MNHFIVSQVNPHSYILSSLATTVQHGSPMLYGVLSGVLRFLKAQCRDWLRNVTDLIVYRGSVAGGSRGDRGFSQLLTQEYEGRTSDVSIMPWHGLGIVRAFLSLIKNPTDEEYQAIIKTSERNTWPHISKIRAHCAIEQTLDRCVQKLRRQVAALSPLDTSPGGPVALDRTPSFYTSRSMVNLSGLGVVDPLPLSSSSSSFEAPADSSGGGGGGGGSGSGRASPFGGDQHSSGKSIQKTTSMADFYYSRTTSGSNESLLEER